LPKLAALLRELPWTHNLLIMSRSKRDKEREFYLKICGRERWNKCELQRQLNGALFERVVLSPVKLSPLVTELHPDAASIFKDSYFVEFLNLPGPHAEADLHRGLVARLKEFLIELGRDFCYVGSHYPVQVGGKDFELDLLFFNRALNCLVAVELKVEEFQPEQLGKLNFYLEALDRKVRKPHEGPSIGVLLCATKNQEVVDFALSRSLSPALVAEYQTRLPEKTLLQAKLHEFYELASREEYCNRRPRPASEQYTCRVVLCELLTDRVPFEGSKLAGLREREAYQFDPGGITAISRRSSEATPPESVIPHLRPWRGSQRGPLRILRGRSSGVVIRGSSTPG